MKSNFGTRRDAIHPLRTKMRIAHVKHVVGESEHGSDDFCERFATWFSEDTSPDHPSLVNLSSDILYRIMLNSIKNERTYDSETDGATVER